MAEDRDRVFDGSIPELYDRYLVPLLFAPYAADLAKRLRVRAPARVLEIAAGTGAVTRALADALPTSSAIVATDLNQSMLDRAAALGTSRDVEWRQADAMRLPFPDGSFDAVVCQFGAMFFPDKAHAFSEVRRALRPGGVFIFSVWDRIAENEFADAVTSALVARFPDRPPRFLARTPHGYSDAATIVADLAAAGFTSPPEVATVEARSRAGAARVVAVAFCQGTPLGNEIDPQQLPQAIDAAEAALVERFGAGAIDGRMQALVVSCER